MTKRITAIILAITLVLTFPAAVFADEAEDKTATGNETVTASEAEEIEEIGNVRKFTASAGYNSVTLKWKSVMNADGYRITWKCGKKKGKYIIEGGKRTSYVAKVPATYQNKDIKYSISAYTDSGLKSKKAASCTGGAVRTMMISFTLNTTRTLTSHDKAAKKHTFKKGTKINASGYDWGRYIFDYNGHVYYVKRISTMGAKISQLKNKLTYSKTEAQNFVNQRGLKSKTDQLIWVNTYTQKLYVFRGKKGNWKLIKGPWKVATGQAKTPTATGMARVRSKSVGCKDPFPQTPWWNVCSQFSIHGKAPYYPAMGKPASHGCVRNDSKNAKWMYKKIKIGTGVYVF